MTESEKRRDKVTNKREKRVKEETDTEGERVLSMREFDKRFVGHERAVGSYIISCSGSDLHFAEMSISITNKPFF